MRDAETPWRGSVASVSVKSTIPFESLMGALEFSTLEAEVLSGQSRSAGSRKKPQRVVSQGPILTVGSTEGNDLVLDDPTVSRYHVEFEATPRGIRATDHRSTNGTRVGPVLVERAVLPEDVEVQVGQTTLRIRSGERRQVTEGVEGRAHGLVGQSHAMRHLVARTEKAARSGASTLIVGESGTGKELVARALHELSDRKNGPFVTVDCGTIMPNLIASELFGHERGAFTGAERRHIGAFEQANGGTVFLDELGELPASLQPTLLGALERRRFRRVGGTEDIEVDVRLVAATNRDLRAEVNEGRFRLDLYFRLAVVTLLLPPLRERQEDIPALVDHFCRELGHLGASPIDESLMSLLEGHSWPGNVRELRNLVEATLAMGEAPDLLLTERPSTPSDDPIEDTLGLTYKEARAALLQRFEARYLGHWLEKCGGNVAATARSAKMDRSHLFQLLKRHGLRTS